MARVDDHFRLRIPSDVKEWVKQRAAENVRSITAEVVFLLKEKMQQETGVSSGNSSPVSDRNNAALAGGASINQ